jgi:hypothetical protein
MTVQRGVAARVALYLVGVVVQCRFERCGVGLLASDWARRTVEWWEGSRKVPWSRRVREREVRRAAAWFWTSYGKIR